MNAAEPQQVAEARATSRRKVLEDVLTVRDIMSTPRGRRWIWDLLSAARLFHEDMNTEPGWMAFCKGERNFGLRIYSTVSINCPNEYVQMVRENTKADLKDVPDAPKDEMTDG